MGAVVGPGRPMKYGVPEFFAGRGGRARSVPIGPYQSKPVQYSPFKMFDVLRQCIIL